MNLEKLYKKINELSVTEDSIELKQEILKEIQVEIFQTEHRADCIVRLCYENQVHHFLYLLLLRQRMQYVLHYLQVLLAY